MDMHNRQFHAIPLAFVTLLLVFFVAGCSTTQEPSSVAERQQPFTDLCRAEPGVCETLCANCPDKAACLKSGGVCQVSNDYYIDRVDGGDNIWMGGCHYSFSDAACSRNQAFHMGDLCGNSNPDLLIEWINAQCHPAQGDTTFYDCDKECRRIGAPGGTCVVLRDYCGAGQHSARCKCTEL